MDWSSGRVIWSAEWQVLKGQASLTCPLDGAPSFHLGMSLAKGVEVNPLAGNLHTFGCTPGGKLFFECALIDFIYK